MGSGNIPADPARQSPQDHSGSAGKLGLANVGTTSYRVLLWVPDLREWPQVNLKQLEYFVSVAELGSFSKAALILNIAQPALSRQVRLLETDLHVTLLMRNGRGVVLTEAGKRLFDHSVGILQLVARVREDIAASRDEPSGRIVVGLPPSMGRMLTLPLVEGFRRTLPKARLAIVEGLSTHLAEWISTGRVDLGLLHNPEPQSSLEHAGAG